MKFGQYQEKTLIITSCKMIGIKEHQKRTREKKHKKAMKYGRGLLKNISAAAAYALSGQLCTVPKFVYPACSPVSLGMLTCPLHSSWQNY